MTLLEGTGSRSRNHRGVIVAPLPEEKSVSGIAPHSQYNSLYDWLLVALKAIQTWVGDYRK